MLFIVHGQFFIVEIIVHELANFINEYSYKHGSVKIFMKCMFLMFCQILVNPLMHILIRIQNQYLDMFSD